MLQTFPSNKRAKIALAKLHELKKRNPGKNRSQESIGQLIALLNQGNLNDVAERAGKLINEFPKNFMLWNILGAANRGLGHLELAVESFRKACETNPKFPDAYNNLAVTLNTQGEYYEAVKNFSRAIELKPDYAEAHYNLGVTHLRQGKLDEAVASFTQALVIRPKYAEAHNDLGVTYQGQYKYDEALASFKRVIELNSDHAEVHNNIGATYHKQGKLDEAIASFNRALEIKADYAEVHDNLGSSYQQKGALAEAVTCYVRAIEIEPGYTKAHFNCAILPTGILSDDLLHRLEGFAAVNKEEHDNPNFQFFKANILRHKGKIAESFKMLQVANNTAENRAEIQNWEKKTEIATNEITKWKPSLNKRQADEPYKMLFILGPSRSGKSTIESTLGTIKGVRKGVEGWRNESAIKYLKAMRLNRPGASKFQALEAKMEELFYFTDEDILGNKCWLLTGTNPSIISVAHLIFETFDNAYFLFVKRDEYVTASEIFSRNYRTGNHYSYNAKSALRYVQ